MLKKLNFKNKIWLLLAVAVLPIMLAIVSIPNIASAEHQYFTYDFTGTVKIMSFEDRCRDVYNHGEDVTASIKNQDLKYYSSAEQLKKDSGIQNPMQIAFLLLDERQNVTANLSGDTDPVAKEIIAINLGNDYYSEWNQILSQIQPYNNKHVKCNLTLDYYPSQAADAIVGDVSCSNINSICEIDSNQDIQDNEDCEDCEDCEGEEYNENFFLRIFNDFLQFIHNF